MKIVILLVAVAVFYLAYVIKHKNDKNKQEQPVSLNDFEQRAAYFKAQILEKNLLKLDISDEKVQLEAVENDFIKLRERFKHNAEKLKQITIDWYEYCHSMYEIHSARQLLDVATGPEDPYDDFEASVKEPWIKIREIEKRFEEDLGKEAQITNVNKQLEEKHKSFSLSAEISKLKNK